MKTLGTVTVALTLALFSSHAGADSKKPAAKPSPAAASATKEIEHAFGFVPGFVKSFPEALLSPWWEGTKALEMNPGTALDGKTKELIGLAVAAQIPCEYCIYFHTEVARLNGATEQEIDEAVGMASMTRLGSTVLNGVQVDKAQFRSDIRRIVKNARAQAHK